MSISLVVPLVVAFAAAYVVMSQHSKLPPRLTAWLLVLVGSASAIAAGWLLVTLSLAFVGQRLGLDRWLRWCDPVVSHHDVVPTPIGVAAIAGLLAMSVAVLRTVRRYRNGWQPSSGEAMEVLDDTRVIAHAIPGRHGVGGTVVVSTGLIAVLEPGELAAVMAHENAHLEHAHHRFLATIDVAAAIAPFLRPLRAHIRLATERWADEDAAAEVGSRRLVATAVARAALALGSQPYRLAMNGSSTMKRVAALLEPGDMGSPVRVLTVAVSGMAAGAVVATAVQVHHAVGLFAHLCS